MKERRVPRPIGPQTKTARQRRRELAQAIRDNLNQNVTAGQEESKHDIRPERDLVLRAIRFAELAHRTRKKGPHHRKAPEGNDKPSYMVHLAEVAAMLTTAGADEDLVAAGWLHDVLEDTDFNDPAFLVPVGNQRVADLVMAVTELDKSRTWENRNQNYLERMKTADADVLNLSCADKTANIAEMCDWLDQGYRCEDFTSRDHLTQLAKFEALDAVYRGKVEASIYNRFRAWLEVFRRFQGSHPPKA